MSETGVRDAGADGCELTYSMTVDGRHVPEEIRDEKIWTIWDLDEKVPLAPWETGHCYRAAWNSDMAKDERPEVDYDTARMWSQLPPEELHRTHPFPTTDENDEPLDDPVPDQLETTILLPPYPAAMGFTPALMYIDFDDVRDPDTGKVSAEVRDLIDRLDSFAEVSSSGTGLHVLVWAELPERLGDFIEDLHGVGSIEIYDHSRFYGGTWQHIEGTPTEINERQDVVDEIIEEYETHDTTDSSTSGDFNSSSSFGGGSASSSGSRSPYYDADLSKFAEPKNTVANTSNKKSKKGPQGSHPSHGKTTSGDKSTNYHLDPAENRWYCFAHNSGGGPLEMAAIMAGEMNCRDAGSGSLNQLSDKAFLKTCLYARDRLMGYDDEMDPPYRALIAIADLVDLSMVDEDQRILGQTTHKLASHLYESLSVDTVGDLGD